MYRAIRRVATLLAALALGLTVAQSSAFAAGVYPVTQGPLETTSQTTQLPQGATITVTGSGFAPGAEVVITAESTPTLLGTTKADATGSISATVSLNLPPGRHTITATGPAATGGTLELSLVVTIGSMAMLAHTGTDVGTLGVVGGGAAAAGCALLLITRRRRSRATV